LGIRRIFIFKTLLDFNLQAQVEAAFDKIHSISNLQSPHISFCIKGLCFITNLKGEAIFYRLADNLVSKYRGVSNESGNGMKITLPIMH
jgi:hypothetical protein